jgi:hypothetical protein
VRYWAATKIFVAGRQGMAGLASERVERRLTAILAVDVAG